MNVKNSGPIIKEELKLIQVMIRLYYSKHTTTDIPEKRMFAYAQKRLLFCPFGEKKPPVKSVQFTVISHATGSK